MQAYLFVHFREKTTPDGEQVYFGVSKDGFNWEEVNGGAPVLWAYYGDKGVRDFTVVRMQKSTDWKGKICYSGNRFKLVLWNARTVSSFVG